MAPFETVYDCVIVGGGLAGLSAAHRLGPRNILVLEASGRPGGRLFSQPRPPYWLNFGAHMFGGPGTIIGDLTAELGLPSEPIRGALLGMAMDGRRLLGSPVESYPLRLPLPLAARLSLVKLGLTLRRGSDRVVKALRPLSGETPAETRARVLQYDNERTLAEMVGPLHPEIATILTAITERTGGDPTEMAAGYALRSFANVWSQHSPGRNLIGGSSRLPEALAARLGGRLLVNSPVESIVQDGDHAVITARIEGETRVFRALSCIAATPAPITRRIVPGLAPATATALASLRYGAFLSVAVLTDEVGPMPWDRMYAISTPKRAFSVLFNQAATQRGTAQRLPGGSLMLFRGAKGAERLMQLSDPAIKDLFIKDLLAEFPEVAGHIQEIIVQRWEAGAPYAVPGRGRLQPTLAAPAGRIVLAGDYLEFPNMEAAAATGFEAAAHVIERLLPPLASRRD